MDRKNTLILKELDLDARQSNAQLARKVGLSKDAVKYRINKLEDKGIIQGYYSIIDYYKLGFNISKILIKFSNIGEKGEVAITNWLENEPTVLWVAQTEGYWDIIYTIQAKKMSELILFMETFKKQFPKTTSEIQLLLAQECTFLNEKHLYDKEDENKFEEIKIQSESIKIDARDEKIIKELEENSRAPLVAIADKLEITPEAVLQRIKKLKKTGIIKRFKSRINFEALGLEYNHTYLAIKDYSKLIEIEKYYKKMDYCTFIMKYQGNYQIHLEWVTKPGHLRKYLKELKEKFGDYIAEYHAINIFKEFKML